MRNGEGPFSDQLGVFCGSTGPPDIFSSSSHLWVKFFSDSVNSAPGFTAVFTAEAPVCGSRLALTATNITQFLQSPNFGPGNLYPLGVNCEWILDSGSRLNRISVSVVELDLEQTEGCEKDRLRLEDLNTRWRSPVSQEAGGPLVVSSHTQTVASLDWWWRTRLLHQTVDHCGSRVPHEFISVGSSVKISFRSDSTVARPGFRLEYKLATCGRDHDRDHGRIFSPSWPSGISANTDCTFTISAPANTYISVYFRYFSISSAANCTANHLTVWDGEESGPRLGRLCGHGLPPTLHSSGPRLTFRLHTERGWSGGYDLSYTATPGAPGCGGQIFGTRGAVTSQNYPANHNTTSDCTWVLRVPRAQRIQIRFDTFNIHSNERGLCDGNYLEIIDGLRSDTVRRLTPRYCGSSKPANHVSSTSVVSLRYVTNTNNTGQSRHGVPSVNLTLIILTRLGLAGSLPDPARDNPEWICPYRWPHTQPHHHLISSSLVMTNTNISSTAPILIKVEKRTLHFK